MLYEAAYPALYLGAKAHQFSRRTRARLGMAPGDMKRVTYLPDSYYRVACWRLRRMDIELMMRLAPMRAARLSVERFEKTKRTASRPENRDTGYDTKDIRYKGKRVHLRMCGPEDGPKIIALHGWNGRVAHLRQMVGALASQGFRVIIPDLPGHGQSEGNRYSFYDLGQAIADIFDGEEFAAIIGHSAGGLIAAIAISRGLKVDCLIPVGSPASLSNLLKSYVDITQMPERSLPFIERYYTRRYGIPPQDVGPELVSRLPVRTLVVHDEKDWQVGVENARQLASAAQVGELFVTQGYTHLSVMNADPVHSKITDFVTRGAYA